MNDLWYIKSLSLLMHFLFNIDKSNINAQNSIIEPNSTPVPSPQENDDGLDAAAAPCANDEIDEDDPFSKRR